MPVAKPGTVPRWASLTPSSSTVTPPANVAAIPAWAVGPFTPGNLVLRSGNEYVVISIAGTGTSTTGPVGTGTTVDNAGANQVTWGYVSAVPTTQDSGFQPNTQPPAQYFNWLFYWLYLWILWIQDIANQSFASGGVGPWTGLHRFTGGSGTTAPVVVTAGGNAGAAGIDSTGAANGGGNTGAGVIGRGGVGGTGANGVEGYGSGTAGDGLYGEGAPNGNGATLVGGTSGRGADISGHSNLAAVRIAVTSGAGGQGLDVSGDPMGGNGGTSTGGVGISIGWIGISQGSGPGLAGASFGTGAGVQGAASSGNAGILGQSATAQPAGAFSNSSTGFALEIGAGNGHLTGSTPAGDPGANSYLCPGNVPKARAAYVMANGGSLTLTKIRGVNVASAIVKSGDHSKCDVSFARNIGTANYGVHFEVEGNGALRPEIVLFTKTATGFTFDVVLVTTGGGVQDLSAVNFVVEFWVWAD